MTTLYHCQSLPHTTTFSHYHFLLLPLSCIFSNCWSSDVKLSNYLIEYFATSFWSLFGSETDHSASLLFCWGRCATQSEPVTRRQFWSDLSLSCFGPGNTHAFVEAVEAVLSSRLRSGASKFAHSCDRIFSYQTMSANPVLSPIAHMFEMCWISCQEVAIKIRKKGPGAFPSCFNVFQLSVNLVSTCFL